MFYANLKNILKMVLPEPAVKAIKAIKCHYSRYFLIGACKFHFISSQVDSKVLYVFPIIDWRYRFQRPQHLARFFARNGYVVYYFCALANRYRPGYEITCAEPNIYLITLNANMNIDQYRDRMNEATLSFILKSLARFEYDHCITKKLIKVDYPFWIDLAAKITDNIIYDCMDDSAGFADGSIHLSALEDKTALLAKLLIVSSSALYNRFCNVSNNCVLIENACDFDFFTHPKYHNDYRHLKTKLQGRKVVGYFGAISHWFDMQLVISLARELNDFYFVFIGSTMGSNACDLSMLLSMQNVLFLGEKPYVELPAYLELFDVCIIPFKASSPLIVATNPVKMFEYLSQGKPVVSIAVPETEKYSNYLYIARNSKEFREQIIRAFDERHDKSLINARVDFAKHNSWNDRAKVLFSCLDGIKDTRPLVSVIVLTYNNLCLTKKCLHSVMNYSNYTNLEIIIVDNASSDGTQDYLKSLQSNSAHNIQVILNSNNLGFSAGNNLGIMAAKGKFIVILNNDTFVSFDWISRLLAHFNRDGVGMVGPVTNNIGNEAKIDTDNYSNDVDFLRVATINYYKNLGKEYISQSSLAFFCVMIPKYVIEQVGLLDENFGRGWFEDDDYNIRVISAGYSAIIADDVLIHHEHSASFNQLDKEESVSLFARNQAYFEAKHNRRWVMHKSQRRNSKGCNRFLSKLA